MRAGCSARPLGKGWRSAGRESHAAVHQSCVRRVVGAVLHEVASRFESSRSIVPPRAEIDRCLWVACCIGKIANRGCLKIVAQPPSAVRTARHSRGRRCHKVHGHLLGGWSSNSRISNFREVSRPTTGGPLGPVPGDFGHQGRNRRSSYQRSNTGPSRASRQRCRSGRDGSRVWADSPTLEMVTRGDRRFKGRNRPPGRGEPMHAAVVRWRASRAMSH